MTALIGRNQLQIEDSNSWKINSVLRNDEMIMKLLVGCKLSESKLHNVNACCIFLQVVCNWGLYKNTQGNHGIRRISQRTLPMEWPNQPIPTQEVIWLDNTASEGKGRN